MKALGHCPVTEPGGKEAALACIRSTRSASPMRGRSRLIPVLEKPQARATLAPGRQITQALSRDTVAS